jgi:glycosyltransferase involved in cell wall biosynthesis
MPRISALCVTAGRVPQLNEAMHCFLAQDWPNKQLVIVNTLASQTLEGDFPNVKIINLEARPISLGSARNIAVRNSDGEVLANYDDDDLYADDFLSTFAAHFKEGVEWVFHPLQFYSEAGLIRKIVPGSANVLAFTRRAFETVGGYPEEMSVGEDRALVGKITSGFTGVRIPQEGFVPKFLYGWANSVWHISGQGDDKPGRATAWERSRLDLERRIRSGTVKTGRIVLAPHIKVPPAERIATFLASKQHLATISPGETLRASNVKLVHAVERHEEPTNRRKEQAWDSWKAIYAQGVVPSHYWKYGRDATSIGDKRKLPFLKDVLAFAMENANDDDVVFLTNDDIVIHPQLPDRLLRHVLAHGPCSSQRCEFRGNIPKLTLPPEQIASLGRLHMGRDLFAGTKRWWLSVWEQIGDPVLGASDFDLHLACLIRKHHGIESTRKNLEQNLHPAELPRGFLIHQFHVPAWADRRNVSTAASQKHNRLAFRKWSAEHLPALAFHAGNIV